MENKKLNERKEMLTKLIHDPAYRPMKAKEIAILLDIPKEQRGELMEVLDALVEEGKIGGSRYEDYRLLYQELKEKRRY